MKTISYTLFALIMFVFVATSSQSQVLYGASVGDTGVFAPSSLYVIDQNTGSATLVSSFLWFKNVTGMAFLPDGRLVASANYDEVCGDPVDLNFACSVLIQVEIATGKLSIVGIMGVSTTSCGRFPDLTYDAATDTLYAYGDFCEGTPEGLYTVNTTTGHATPVGGPSGFTSGGNGLAIDPSDSTIYGTPRDDDCLVVLDPVTGAGMCVPGSNGNVPSTVNALDFGPDGKLYGSLRSGGNSLVTIDLTDGNTTIIGETVLGLDAIAFGPPGVVIESFSRPVPTISEWGLIALAGVLGFIGFIAIRRRRAAV